MQVFDSTGIQRSMFGLAVLVVALAAMSCVSAPSAGSAGATRPTPSSVPEAASASPEADAVAAGEASRERLVQPADTQVASAAKAVPARPSGPTLAQRAFVAAYVERLSCVAGIREPVAEADRPALRTALAMARSWLQGRGLESPAAAQAERLRRERAAAGEPAEAAWLGAVRDAGADACLGIEARIERDARGANRYAKARVVVWVYDAATGRELGAAPAVDGPQRMSSIDQADADAKALQDAVFAALPRAWELARGWFAERWDGGIAYVARFRGAQAGAEVDAVRGGLARNPDVAAVSVLPDDPAALAVRMYARPDEFADAVRSAIPGREWRAVERRGKEIVFE